MKTRNKFGKFLRFIGILLMSITAGFTVLGGVGTTCAALAPTNWESMAPLARFQWLYILYVILTIAIGILGIRAVILLIKAKSNGYKAALFALISGVSIGVIHIITSRILRGSSMPVDAVVGTTFFTLIIFLLFRLPLVWNVVNFVQGSKKDNLTSGGISALFVGGLSISIQHWMGSTHTWHGVNYADAFHSSMIAIGGLLFLVSVVVIFFSIRDSAKFSQYHKSNQIKLHQ